MRQKILEVAVEQFSRFGVRTVTMEDIARLVGISKKTIYQDFKDKKELVKEAFSMLLKHDQEKLRAILNDGDGVIDHLLQMSKTIRDRLANMNPMVILEVQRYFPEAWEMFEKYKEEIIMTDIVNVLEKGKALGYFREDIDSHILARMRINQINSVFDPSNFKMEGYSILDLQIEMLDHFLHGVFTEKGRLAYQQQKTTTTNERI
ncbi:TetR/AcrR family transcriptional regulator [Algoriphagus pacificus]|uniref:TetR/AcrR family transcriptional regulator n=1 Tax=Algoriphagus pacificus TaxID=2811234 RepID=A0ABS3CES0_9BACT|nr:TetR/AcrR family transcriptional regulator [Algoriphagus pacificus]MBN7815522.1 TetR/AcrR family transcriptional regulator [Algoriphagus pacificus]